MIAESSQSLKAILLNKYFYPLFLAVVYSGTFYSLIDPLLNAYKRGDFLVTSVYLAFFGFAFFMGFLLRPKQRVNQPPIKGVFRGVCKLSSDNAWPRINEKIKLCETIKHSAEKPIILVGPSGVGKSTLLETQVIPSLRREGWNAICFSNYDTFQDQLLEMLITKFPNLSHKQFREKGTIVGMDNNVKLILVYDQFERFLSANSENVGEHKKIREWFRSFLKATRKLGNIKHLITVRKEWYYDLRFLAEFVPPPIKCFHISGLKINENESCEFLIANRIKTVTKNPNVAETILTSLRRNNEIFPIEAQMVGLMLENKAREIGEIDSEYYLKELGGKEGLIQSYFNAYLDSAPDRNVCLKVLFALSVITEFKSQHSLSQIASIIHESKSAVLKCISFLMDQGLALETKSGQYEVAHDYLAEKFHEVSGSELDPVERDNIIFLSYEIRASSKPLDITRPQSKSTKTFDFSNCFAAILILILLARLMGPIYGVKWEWFNPSSKFQIQKMGLDIYYLPIFISHLAWGMYINLFYRRFFSHLKESKSGRLFSKFVVVNSTALVLVSAFIPLWWFFLIGIGGFPLGWKLYQLRKTPGLGKVSSIAFFKNTGRNTMTNLLIVMAVGVGLVYYVYNSPLSYNLIERVNVIFYLASMFMVYYMIVVSPIHITRSAVSKMMGLFDRGRVRLQRLNLEFPKS